MRLRRDRSAPGLPGALALTGTFAGRASRRAGAGLVERFDFRIPDAAAGHAELRKDPSGPDISRSRAIPNRVRRVARRALGRVSIRVQSDRCALELPVPGLWRARPGIETRPG